jgi:hypothetical protein
MATRIICCTEGINVIPGRQRHSRPSTSFRAVNVIPGINIIPTVNVIPGINVIPGLTRNPDTRK